MASLLPSMGNAGGCQAPKKPNTMIRKQRNPAKSESFIPIATDSRLVWDISSRKRYLALVQSLAPTERNETEPTRTKSSQTQTNSTESAPRKKGNFLPSSPTGSKARRKRILRGENAKQTYTLWSLSLSLSRVSVSPFSTTPSRVLACCLPRS